MRSGKPRRLASCPAAQGIDDAGTFVGSNSSNGDSKRASQIEKSPEQHDGNNPVGVTADANAKEEDETEYPKGLRLFLIMFALSATIFLLAFDQTIVSTAAPTITNQFNALQDVGWYGSAYLLTATALQPMFGKIYSFFSRKWVFVAALFIFELGSLICAVTQDSPTLIVGRAIAGIGLAGGYIGILIIIAACTPVSKRAIYSSLIAVTNGGGAICGSILGGVFTSAVT
ncbi:unnamed protein product [Sympodiomycopsis kandeliae]